MKIIIFICSLIYFYNAFAKGFSNQTIIMNGVKNASVENTVQYLNLVNKTLPVFNRNKINASCLRNRELLKESIKKVSSSSIIYINEWLRAPGVCAYKHNRKKGESKKLCYKRAQKNFIESIPYIEKAANEFNIDPSHLACLYLQESQFIETAASGTGAVGLAQISTGTLATQTVIFNSRDINCKSINSKNCSKIRGSNVRGQCRKNKAHCRTKTRIKNKKYLVKQPWANYAKYVNSRVDNKSKIDGKNYSSSKDKLTCRKNMYWSIGAGARYISEIENFDVSSLVNIDTHSKKETFLLAASLYNPGPGLKRSMLSPIKKSTRFKKGWENSIPRVIRRKRNVSKEPKKYVKNIRKCIEYKIGDSFTK